MPGSNSKRLGYCNRGDCGYHVCKSTTKDGRALREFCGISEINPCKASCSTGLNGECYDTATSVDGGEQIEDGAVCLKDRQKGAFRLGSYASM